MQKIRILGKSMPSGAQVVIAFVAIAAISTAWSLLPPEVAMADSATGTQQLFNYPETSLKGVNSAEVSISADGCRKLCNERSGCAGFDYNSKGNSCRMFTSVVSCREDVISTAATRALINGCKDSTNPLRWRRGWPNSRMLIRAVKAFWP